jgi:hypothetical protein
MQEKPNKSKQESLHFGGEGGCTGHDRGWLTKIAFEEIKMTLS